MGRKRKVNKKQISFHEKWDGSYLKLTGLYMGEEYHVYGICRDLYRYRDLKERLIKNIENRRNINKPHHVDGNLWVDYSGSFTYDA